MQRDNEGRIILDNLKIVDNYTEGRKPKIWLSDGQNLFLFKINAMNYENYAELIASELAQQCGLETAHYDLAIYKGKTGIVTPNFLKPNDIIISGEEILNDGTKIARQNNFKITLDNSLESIVIALNLRYGFTNIDEIINSLISMWCFDLLISESDRNMRNWSIISNKEGIKLAPIYDCSTMAFLNNDISSYMNRLYSYNTLLSMLDSLKLSMHYRKGSSDETLFTEFETLCRQNLAFVENVMPKLLQIDVEQAIKNIEKRHSTNKLGDKEFEIPALIGIWVNKIVELRKKDMLNILNRVLKENKELSNKRVK